MRQVKDWIVDGLFAALEVIAGVAVFVVPLIAGAIWVWLWTGGHI